MILTLPKPLCLIARHFAGTRISMAKRYVVKNTTGCCYEGIIYPFDPSVMDGKRLIALASGSIEAEEIALAQKYLETDDVVVEFGSGLGIAAARVHQAVKPKAHFCFEANPVAFAYSKKLFETNHMPIELTQIALGDGTKAAFYAAEDYILSSFDKPKDTRAYKKIEVPTTRLATVIKAKQPTAIFCDIEGAEATFLQAEDMDGVRKVIIELHPGVYGSAGVERLKRNFSDNGFKSVARLKDTYCFWR